MEGKKLKKSIITVLGKDSVGIIAKVCTYLANNNVNILDINQTITGGFFNMMMIVESEEVVKTFPVMARDVYKRQIVDCAIGSMSSLTSQPSMNALVEALRGTKRDTGIDPDGLLVLNEYYEHERKVYKPFESDMDSPNPEIYKYEIPGGQYSN